METFDSTKSRLYDILKDVAEGKIQLPDFQRGWIWDDYRIKGLLASIAKSFPIGAIMLLETGNPDVRFKTRFVEGVNLDKKVEPEKLILDGQQRITSLYQAIISNNVVRTRNEKGYEIYRWYYIDMKKALDENTDLEEAIFSINERKVITEDFGRKIILDLSKPEYEYENMMYPVKEVDEYHEWRSEYNKYWKYDPEKTKFWDEFEKKVINNFNNYMLPVITMKNNNSKEAVCQVFEKVNTGGVALNVFELLTAVFAADNFDLRSDWENRKKSFKDYKVLSKTENTDFIQSVTLLATYLKRKKAESENIPVDQLPAVSAKRKDMLQLTLENYKSLADKIQQGFINSAKLLFENNIFSANDLPYTTQLIPMAAIFAALNNQSLTLPQKEKLVRWYWCGVFGELYGGANETRYALDVYQVLDYLNNGPEPKTIYDAHFNPSRLYTLRTRNSAAYKGIYALLMKDGAMDFITGAKIDFNTYFEESIDVHHIFPRAWCEKNKIKKEEYDCIVNKTPLSARTNRIIGGAAPGVYLEKLRTEHKLSKEKIEEILLTHICDPISVYNNDFYTFFEKRKNEMLKRIMEAMGKQLDGSVPEEGKFIGNGEENEE
uniref:DUF262 domain-containing protein n=1 Tax=Ignavibacterium album TaxID=591197 RepID=A0A7V2ZKI7_9BACT